MTVEEQVQMVLREVAALRERVATLESKLQRREDEEGYAEQGARYSGKHPARCACNRCLQSKFGSWSEP